MRSNRIPRIIVFLEEAQSGMAVSFLRGLDLNTLNPVMYWEDCLVVYLIIQLRKHEIWLIYRNIS